MRKIVALVRPVKFQLWSQVDNDRSLSPPAYWKCALKLIRAAHPDRIRKGRT